MKKMSLEELSPRWSMNDYAKDYGHTTEELQSLIEFGSIRVGFDVGRAHWMNRQPVKVMEAESWRKLFTESAKAEWRDLPEVRYISRRMSAWKNAQQSMFR